MTDDNRQPEPTPPPSMWDALLRELDGGIVLDGRAAMDIRQQQAIRKLKAVVLGVVQRRAAVVGPVYATTPTNDFSRAVDGVIDALVHLAALQTQTPPQHREVVARLGTSGAAMLMQCAGLMQMADAPREEGT